MATSGPVNVVMDCDISTTCLTLVSGARRLLEHEVMPSHAPRYAVTLWIWRETDDEEKYMLS